MSAVIDKPGKEIEKEKLLNQKLFELLEVL